MKCRYYIKQLWTHPFVLRYRDKANLIRSVCPVLVHLVGCQWRRDFQAVIVKNVEVAAKVSAEQFYSEVYAFRDEHGGEYTEDALGALEFSRNAICHVSEYQQHALGVEKLVIKQYPKFFLYFFLSDICGHLFFSYLQRKRGYSEGLLKGRSKVEIDNMIKLKLVRYILSFYLIFTFCE